MTKTLTFALLGASATLLTACAGGGFPAQRSRGASLVRQMGGR